MRREQIGGLQWPGDRAFGCNEVHFQGSPKQKETKTTQSHPSSAQAIALIITVLAPRLRTVLKTQSLQRPGALAEKS